MRLLVVYSPHGIPWQPMEAHGIPWQPMESYGMQEVRHKKKHENRTQGVRGIRVLCNYLVVGDSPHGIPWHPMASHGIPWQPMAAHGSLWHAGSKALKKNKKIVLKASVVSKFYAIMWWLVTAPMASHGIPWHPMAAHGSPWHPMAAHGIPWHPMASHGSPWHPMASHGLSLIHI